MFHCPVCLRMILVRNGSDIVKHLSSHRSFGDPFSWPLGCLLCQGLNLKNVKTFKQHYETCHCEVFEVSVVQGCCNVERQDAQNVTVDNVDDRAGCISDNILVLNNRAGYEAIILSGLFTFMSNSSIPHTSIERIIRFCSDYVSVIVNNVTNVFTKFRETEISDRTDQDKVTVLQESVQEELNVASSSLNMVDTTYKIKSLFENNPKYVAPVPIELGLREEIRLAGSCPQNIVVKNLGYHVPISKTLISQASNREFYELIEKSNRYRREDKALYQCYRDGSNHDQNLLAQDESKIVAELQFWNDDMGTTNPLRGHGAAHKVGQFFFTFLDLPLRFNSAFPNIHLFFQYNSLDAKTHGMAKVLEPVMEDMKMLEREGVVVDVDGIGPRRIFATLSQFTGDALAINQMFGLTESFLGDFCCSICYAKRKDMSTKFLDRDFVKRSTASHSRDVLAARIEEEKRENGERAGLNVNGVKHDSLLNRSLYFHTAKNLTIDIMHTLPEGIIPYVVGAILFDFIHIRKLFSWDDLNSKIRCLFSCLEVDKGNTPCELNELISQKNGLSPKLTAVEMLSLFHYIPILIGDYLPEDDAHWRLLLQLQTITDLAYAPKITESLLQTFSDLYKKHMKLFTQLFPYLAVKPKQHFLVHFSEMVRANGPLSAASCLRYELRNGFAKRSAHVVCNFKNISYTLVKRNQYAALANIMNGLNFRDQYKKTHKLTKISLKLFETTPLILLMICSKLGLTDNDQVESSLKASFCGRRYSVGNVVIVGKVEGELQFGIISKIIWFKDLFHLLIEIVKIVGFRVHFHAYEFTKCNKELTEFVFLKVSELYDYHPLDCFHRIEENKTYVRLKYYII